MSLRLILFWVSLPLLKALGQPIADDRPNILVIYADDLGYGDVSAYGQGILPTPNIDKLAQGGVRFTNGYASSATCTPSRYALLTGLYPLRNKQAKILPGDAPLLIDTSLLTLPKMLRNAGYHTGVVGKWHLGLGSGTVNWNEALNLTPNDVGFEESFIMAATNDRTPTVYIRNRQVVGLDPQDPLFVSYQENFEGEPTALTHPELMTTMKWHHGHNNSVHNGIPRIGFMKGGKAALWKDEDMADVFLEEARSFIQKHHPEQTKRPFFLYYALHQPHVPRAPHARFVGKSGMGPRGDAIVEADWCVGEIVRYLEQEGLLENTLILFSSDNGPVLNDGYYDEAVERVGKHTPSGKLRGGKYSLFEAGAKVPFIAYWRGKIQPGVSKALVSQLDFTASLASLLRLSPPPGDGQDVLPALLGKTQKGRRELVLEALGNVAFRQGDFVLIPPSEGEAWFSHVSTETGRHAQVQLYNLAKDPGQRSNQADKYPKRVEKMKGRLIKIMGEDLVLNR